MADCLPSHHYQQSRSELLRTQIKGRLQLLDEVYAHSRPRWCRPPDGIYSVRLDRVQISPPRRGRWPGFRCDFVIVGGRCDGDRLSNHLIIRPDTLPALKAQLEACGLHLERLPDLWDRFPELLSDALVKVRLNTAHGRQSISFLRPHPRECS